MKRERKMPSLGLYTLWPTRPDRTSPCFAFQPHFMSFSLLITLQPPWPFLCSLSKPCFPYLVFNLCCFCLGKLFPPLWKMVIFLFSRLPSKCHLLSQSIPNLLILYHAMFVYCLIDEWMMNRSTGKWIYEIDE